MDWEMTQLLIIPALTVLFQALKRIVAIGENNQYIPIASIVLGPVVTVLWTLAAGQSGSEVIAKAILLGAGYGAAATGLYEAINRRNG